MLSKEEHIRFWITQAEDDWGAIDALFQIGKYSQSLFWAHLVLEKYSKAIWIKDNSSNIPPRTHNLIHLLSQTSLILSEEQQEFLLFVNRFQIEGRYPEYITFMNEICDAIFTNETLIKITDFKIWLIENMQ
jgi:HEPN domain-containing protein